MHVYAMKNRHSVCLRKRRDVPTKSVIKFKYARDIKKIGEPLILL